MGGSAQQEDLPANLDASPEVSIPICKYVWICDVHSSALAGFTLKVTPLALMLVSTPRVTMGFPTSSLCGAAAPGPKRTSTSLALKVDREHQASKRSASHSANFSIECCATSSSSAAKKSSTKRQMGMCNSLRASAFSSWPAKRRGAVGERCFLSRAACPRVPSCERY